MFAQKKKKKVDYEALNSAFMRIPRMDIEAARALLDLGYKETFDIQGLSPEALFEKHKAKKPDANKRILHAIRMALYFIETPTPDPKKMFLDEWSY